MRRWFSGDSGDEQQPPTSRVIHAGEPAEQVTVIHNDGSISEVTVSVEDDQLNVAIDPSVTHLPHLYGHYLG